MKKKYKIWMHLEEITEDENGNDVEYKSIDDEVLPLPLEVVSDIEDAIRTMNNLHNQYYNR